MLLLVTILIPVLFSFYHVIDSDINLNNQFRTLKVSQTIYKTKIAVWIQWSFNSAI